MAIRINFAGMHMRIPGGSRVIVKPTNFYGPFFDSNTDPIIHSQITLFSSTDVLCRKTHTGTQEFSFADHKAQVTCKRCLAMMNKDKPFSKQISKNIQEEA